MLVRWHVARLIGTLRSRRNVRQRSPLWLTGRRWLSLILCGLCAGAIWIILAPLLAGITDRLGQRAVTIPAAILVPAITTAVVAAIYPFGRRRWLAFFGLKHPLTYPSLSIAVLIGLIAIVGHEAYVGPPDLARRTRHAMLEYLSSVPRWSWLIAAFPAILVLCLELIDSHRSRVIQVSHRPYPPVPTVDGAAHRLFAWLQDDTEIHRAADDRFGFGDIVDRIVVRLTDNDYVARAEPQSIAVIGPAGSGKSSIKNLVKERLSSYHHYRLIDISLWPYDSPEAAVRGILAELLRQLGREVNVVHLVGISDDYIASIEKAAGLFGLLARLMRGSADPESIIRQLSEVAQAVQMHLVLWIEDFERFSGADRLSGEKAVARDVERMGSIRALLHLLDRAANISVIIADTSLKARFDLDKIARHIERLPRVPPATAWRDVELLRRTCAAAFPRPIIDPRSDDARAALDVHAYTFEMWNYGLSEDTPSVPLAIAWLLHTPRSLKTALRLTLETWSSLGGEIDIDTMLVASVLRTERPDLFAVIDECVDTLRREPRQERDVEWDRTRDIIGRHLSDEATARSRNAITQLLTFLFPQFSETRITRRFNYIESPQALDVNRHANYWKRYLTGAPESDVPSDQETLKSIASWKVQRSQDIVERLVRERHAGQIETFVGQFTGRDLCRLLTETAALLSQQSAAEWFERSRSPGLVSVVRMMIDRRPPVSVLRSTVGELIKAYTPVHLPLAYDISYWLIEANDASLRLCDTPPSDMEGLLRTEFVTAFGSDAQEKFLRALQGGSPYLLSWVCWGIRTIRQGEPDGIPFAEWPQIAAMLLSAAEARPLEALPQIVPFITTGDYVTVDHPRADDARVDRTREWRAEFIEHRARTLFDFDRLIGLLARSEIPPNLGDQATKQFRAARDAAQTFVSQVSD